ncbi:hypothetical protein [Aeromonas caviae]|uniref:hypothetical protein n=1 Tax=Aeromonas caviae TaxID=648 RepID=UPI0029DC377F|nr:hypothetical protein [Aeromonas caviae]MDX7852989.1 hypothetical protein [Aeromonas caviae]
MSALIETRTLTLKGKGKSSSVVVHQLNGLQLFDYQMALLSVEWPQVEGITAPLQQQKNLLTIQRLTFEMSLLLAAMGLNHYQPDLDVEQMKAWVLKNYPDSAHVLRIAMAVKELSGLAALAKEAASGEGKLEPVDPKKG